MDCTASLISVLVAFGATWNTSVFWFSLIARPFSVITGRRMIWYALFITPPPPLFHCAAGDGVLLPASWGLRLLPCPTCAAFSQPSSATTAAASQSPDAKRSRDRAAAGDRDALHCPAPTPARRYSARSSPGCGCRAWPLRRPAPFCPPSAHRAPSGMLLSSAPSRRRHSPQ